MHLWWTDEDSSSPHHLPINSSSSAHNQFIITSSPVNHQFITISSPLCTKGSLNIAHISQCRRKHTECFFNCSRPKNSKCQPVRKFWHLRIFLWDFLQGVFFSWCSPKSSKCQLVSKSWHLELFWWDLLYNLILSHYLGRTNKKKNTL